MGKKAGLLKASQLTFHNKCSSVVTFGRFVVIIQHKISCFGENRYFLLPMRARPVYIII